MANVKGEITRQIGEDLLRFRLSMNALAEIEQLLGQPFQDVLTRIAACAGRPGMDVTATRAIVWGAMLHHAPDATPASAGRVMDTLGLGAVDGLVWDLLEAAGFLKEKTAPEGKEGENPPTPPDRAAA